MQGPEDDPSRRTTSEVNVLESPTRARPRKRFVSHPASRLKRVDHLCPRVDTSRAAASRRPGSPATFRRTPACNPRRRHRDQLRDQLRPCAQRRRSRPRRPRGTPRAAAKSLPRGFPKCRREKNALEAGSVRADSESARRIRGRRPSATGALPRRAPAPPRREAGPSGRELPRPPGTEAPAVAGRLRQLNVDIAADELPFLACLRRRIGLRTRPRPRSRPQVEAQGDRRPLRDGGPFRSSPRRDTARGNQGTSPGASAQACSTSISTPVRDVVPDDEPDHQAHRESRGGSAESLQPLHVGILLSDTLTPGLPRAKSPFGGESFS